MPFALPRFKTFLTASLLLVLNEVLSYLGFLTPGLNTIVFMLIVVLTALLTWQNLESGLLLLLAELFMGGKGYLYSLTIGGNRIAIRIALFTVVMLVWLVRRRYRRGSWTNISRNVRRWILVLGLAVAWGILFGLIRGHGLTAVYFDANAFLFFGLLLPLTSPSIDWQRFGPRLLALLAAAATVLGLKSVVSLGLFAHFTAAKLVSYYRWIRISGIGEVAYINGNAYRVFFQSQIYGLFGLAVLAPLVRLSRQSLRQQWWLLIPLTFGLTAVLVSLSRSFWVGGAVAALVALVAGFRLFRWRLKQLVQIAGLSVVVLALAYTLTSWALNFPYPFPPPQGSQTARVIGERFAAIGGEAAASSRLQLLGPLTTAVLRNPVFGSGFGQTVTYQSHDPRQLQSKNNGWFTTYAFEWGYLDIALKVGAIGLFAYALVLFLAMTELWRQQSRLAFGWLIGLTALIAVHVTTPYLNHPLGIGFLLLAIALARLPLREKL